MKFLFDQSADFSQGGGGMKAMRKAAEPDWRFDGSTITVRIPMTFARRGGRKIIVATDGGDAWAPYRTASPRPGADPRPDIVETILDGRQPKSLQLADLMRTMPTAWEEQRQQFSER